MTSRAKRPGDASQLGKFIVDVAIASQPQRKKGKTQQPHHWAGKEVELGPKLDAQRRRSIAKEAARKRWENRD